MLDAQSLDITSDCITLTDTTALYGSEVGLPCLSVRTPIFHAVVALQGAQVFSFQPEGEEEWLWLSPLARFIPGEAIRGGIPICAPWFGVNRREPTLPKHGFLRNRDWQLAGADELMNHTVRLRFTCASTPEDLAQFAWPFTAELDIYFSDQILMALRITNHGESPMPLSFAFHSYFRVADVAEVSVAELAGKRYLDNTDRLQEKVELGPLCFSGEVDRVYPGVGGVQTMMLGGKQLHVDGYHTDTAILWNPGAELAAGMADVGEHFRDYVCLERGMAFDDEVRVPAGSSYRGVMAIGRRLNETLNTIFSG